MTTPAAADPGPPLRTWERRRLRGIERGLRAGGAWARPALCLGLDAATLVLLAAGIFVALPWLFAGCVAANLAVCLHFERSSRPIRRGGNACPR
ncbi:hypothetical protein AB0F15_20700 [Amycolatopsis sp. NPDC026612]|uniref:hypothetical protein n=1 Tax=Amycolatopsis sp. NPDC026612 TaxID=3155466 RepID=UPI0033F5BB24